MTVLLFQHLTHIDHVPHFRFPRARCRDQGLRQNDGLKKAVYFRRFWLRGPLEGLQHVIGRDGFAV